MDDGSQNSNLTFTPNGFDGASKTQVSNGQQVADDTQVANVAR